MAHVLTATDAHVIMTELVKQATGQNNFGQVDSSNFVSAGETVLATGVENTLNSLSLVLGRTFMAVRPYDAKFKLINTISTGQYSDRLRKISFYARNPLPAGDWNTQLYTNLGAGLTNGQNESQGTPLSTKSQWEQNPGIPLELNFSGSSVWEDSTTIYKYQLKKAFRNESEFAQFASGIMTEKGNDIESQKEAFSRLSFLNFMAGVYDLSNNGPTVINLTAAYNAKFRTSYTSEQLRSTYLRSFLEFFVATFKMYSDRMTYRTAHYHWSPTKTDSAGNSLVILRHTPKSRQKAALYGPLFKEAEAMVMPEIFNPRYLSLENYESFDYWQAFSADGTNNASINIVPAIPNVTNPATQKAGDAVSIPYVVGMLFDEDACMVDFQLDDAESTPMEARKRYYNIWWSFARNAINDFTENAILFTMED